MSDKTKYKQISLTDGCHTGDCAGNPVYGAPNSSENAVKYCQEECSKREGCTGFFFQQHNNKHEICGFYFDDLDASKMVWWRGC